jgi:preprotein translocase subunit YajC
MTDAKTAAGIVSAVIAGVVFLVALFWRRQQRQRDREALLASLEQQYSEKVHSLGNQVVAGAHRLLL